MIRTVRRRIVWLILLVLVVGTGSLVQGQDIEISLQHCWDGPREELLNNMLRDFEAAHPGVKVSTRLISCSDLTTPYVVALAGGRAPDVAHFISGAVVNLGAQGALLPLTPLLERDGISESIWFPSEILIGKYEGIVYGLPIRTGADEGNTLYYNRDHFARAGLPDRAPETWDEFLEFSRRLVMYDGDEIINGPIGERNMLTYRWLYTAGGSLLSEDMRTVTFNSPEGLEAAEFVRDYLATVYRNIGDWGGNRPEFHGGTISMLLSGAFEIYSTLTTAPHLNLGFGLIPLKELDPSIRTVNRSTHHYVITRTTEHPDLAWELVKWLTIRPESAGEFMLAQGRPSPVIELNRNPMYLDINPEFPKFEQILARAVPAPLMPSFDQVYKPFERAFTRIVRGEEGAVGALTNAAEQAQAALDQYWRSVDGN